MQTFILTDNLIGNNNNSIAHCIFYCTKNINEPEDGFITRAETCHRTKQCKKYTLTKSLIELCLSIYCLYL